MIVECKRNSREQVAPSISLVVPAKNEELVIERCLHSIMDGLALLAADASSEIIVALNGCTDQTEIRAKAALPRALSSGVALHIIRTEAGKSEAINAADEMATGKIRIYVDADIVCEPLLIRQLWNALNTEDPRYGSGTIVPVPGAGWFSRSYARIWSSLPFVSHGVCGCGLYAVNQAGRERWSAFPYIHSDDKFVRLQFTPSERIKVEARYSWPVPSGFWNLVRVRSRWCRGNCELERLYGWLEINDDRIILPVSWWWYTLLHAPFEFLCFVGIFSFAHLRAVCHSDSRRAVWERGR